MIELPDLDGLVVAFVVPGDDEALGAWLHVRPDGRIAAYTGKVEVGQGVRTSLSQIVAEELRAPLASIELVMGDTARTPWDIGTFSSLTTRTAGTQLRRVAAVAREALLDLAGIRWRLDRAALTVAAAAIRDDSTARSASFGDLVHGLRRTETVTRTDATTPAQDWSVAGSSAARLGMRALVTGSHRFTSDLVLDGMHCGRVLRAPSFGAELVAADTVAAEAMPGVTVVRADGRLGVTAADAATAARGLSAIAARWRASPQPSRDQLFAHLRDHPLERSGRDRSVEHAAGSLDAGWAQAQTILRRTYTVDYIAHAPLEPRAAVARWADGSLTVWTATQRPFAVRQDLAHALSVPEQAVRVIVPDGGSAFGGKHTGEAAIEAAWLARAAGRPVRVAWSREEEFTWAYFRPAGIVDVACGARADSTLTAWDFRTCNAGSEALETPYRVAHRHVAFQAADSPLRQGPYRALAATANTFARETQLDELAQTLGIDPLEVRRRNLDDARLIAVLDAAAEAFGRRAGRAAGIACGTEKGGYVATCAEVDVDERGGVRVVRVVQAFDCGAVVNPALLRAQIEGAIVQGLGGALFESVAFADGRILNPSFSRYRVPRFSDVPEIEIVLLDRREVAPAGAGESPIVGIAPAVGNAIFAATGRRIRSLPLVPHGMGNAGEDSVAADREDSVRPWRVPAST